MGIHACMCGLCVCVCNAVDGQGGKTAWELADEVKDAGKKAAVLEVLSEYSLHAAAILFAMGTAAGEELLEAYEEKYISVGAQAIDFTGTTFEGHEFKLSDYKGKVVLLDFYGFW